MKIVIAFILFFLVIGFVGIGGGVSLFANGQTEEGYFKIMGYIPKTGWLGVTILVLENIDSGKRFAMATKDFCNGDLDGLISGDVIWIKYSISPWITAKGNKDSVLVYQYKRIEEFRDLYVPREFKIEP